MHAWPKFHRNAFTLVWPKMHCSWCNLDPELHRKFGCTHPWETNPMKELSVYVDVVSPETATTYGDTTIVISKDDPYRSGLLRACELYYTEEGQPDEASKFHQAIKQTPWDSSDDGA